MPVVSAASFVSAIIDLEVSPCVLTFVGTLFLCLRRVFSTANREVGTFYVLGTSSSIVLTSSSEVASLLSVLVLAEVFWPWIELQEVIYSSTGRS